MNDKLQAFFSHILYPIKENKTHYKVSHFLPVDHNPSPPPIAAYLPVWGGGGLFNTLPWGG